MIISTDQQPIILPHRYDRYSLFSIILRHRRQSKSEFKNAVSQPTYSRIERIGEFKGRKNPIKRGRALSILKSVSFSFNEFCLLLWLLEGNNYKPLSIEEKKEYFPEITEFTYENNLKDNWFAHQEIIKLLQECFTQNLDFSERKLHVGMLQGTEYPDFVEYETRLANLEKGKGHRLFMGKYPSILLSKFPKQLAKLFVKNNITLRLKYENVLTDRINHFKDNVKVFGSRCIHSFPSIKRFSRKKDVEGLNIKERIGRIEQMLELLEKVPNFHIALADTEPEWEMMIKSLESVALRPTSRRISIVNYPLVYGPKLIYWQNESLEDEDKTRKNIQTEDSDISNGSKKRRNKRRSDNLWNVVGSYLDFELTWISLHNKGKTDRDYVKSKLESLL